MKKIVTIVFTVLAALVVSVVVFIFAASQPVPEGAEEIIDEVLSAEPSEQIFGDTGRIASGGVNIWYESIKPSGQNKGTILLIMGLGGNALEWPLYFTQPLVNAGYHVIRFDNRSTGLSTWTDHNFSLKDMAGDALAVLDVLKVDSAHIVGMSMGGMVGQIMAIEYPERVKALTSFMSSGYMYDPDLPDLSRKRYLSLIATGIRYGIYKTERNILRATISVRSVLDPEISPARMRTLAEQALYNQRLRKGFNSRAFVQQTRAILGSGSRYEGLRNLKLPALVIHGKQDPLIPADHGIKTAQIIPGAELLLVEGMGHDISPEHTGQVHEAILKLMNR